MREHANKVSIVMRSKNSDWVIGQSLAALFSQSYTNFELIVVDSGSTDKTLEIVKQYPCRLIEIAATDYYPGAVLNQAIEQTKGDIIVFQNSDAVPLTPQTLERLLAAFDDQQTAAAFCRQIPRPEALQWVRRDYATAFPETGQTPDWLPYSLPMAAMRRAAWQQHEFYTAAWGSEDTEWGHWAEKNNHTICYVADALVMHSHNYSLRQIYGRRFIEGEADAYINSENPFFGKLLMLQAAHTLRDMMLSLQNFALSEMALSPVRNAVSNYAYFKGHQLGCHRIRENSSDTSIGQRTVLDRYTG